MTEAVRVGYTGHVAAWTGTLHDFPEGQVVVGRTGKAYEPCVRCENFTGFLPAYHGIDAGVCYKCLGHGVGKVHETLAEAEAALTARAKRRAAAEKRQATRATQDRLVAAAEFAAWAKANPNLAAELPALADQWAPRTDGDYYGDTDEQVDGWLYAAAIRVRNEQVPEHPEALADLLAAYRAEVAAKAATVYAGEVGDEVTITGTVTVALPIDGMYGQSMMLVLTNGPLTVKTFTTAKFAWALNKGDTLTLTGTVKAQDVYEGVKQTVLARPKVVPRETADTPAK